MPLGFDETRLWRSSLAVSGDGYDDERERLRVAYLAFRDRAKFIAGDIPLELREYTVHDITHLDALWEIADLVAGPDVRLSPTEAFVLGGAFLVHDLGMGLAAWPGGLDQLRQESQWPDIVSLALRDELGRPATADEVAHPSDEIVKFAMESILRERHAYCASRLPLTHWSTADRSSEYYLIDNNELRSTYGELIGELAASHWWSIDQVGEHFQGPDLGAPVSFPSEWTVDRLKLACLVRLADAGHLDARRAPPFLRVIRRPSGVSDLHWAFQERMHRPQVDGDRLVYTASPAFSASDAGAWWVCHDSLRMVDQELRGVDDLLADKGRQRFQAAGVKGVDNPRRLSAFVPADGWTPVDAQITVSNVGLLARRLGGESLYGESPQVGLRELIQNARDASQAVEIALGVKPSAIEVALREEDDGSWWLTVTDYGIGMSQAVLTGALLDFGRTYWGSQLMRSETPGLAAGGFEPIGKYGIGFYSVFMLGDEVRVTTRRFDEATVDTRVLEFAEGLNGRPILRPASPGERRHSGGTSVTVRLREDPTGSMGLLKAGNSRSESFDIAGLCAWLAPALDCDLQVRNADGSIDVVVEANDWMSIEPEALFRRLAAPGDHQVFRGARLSLDFIGSALMPLDADDESLGRAALAPSPPAAISPDGTVIRLWGVVVNGGLRVDEIGGAVGIIDGAPLRADRSSAAVSASRLQVSLWASQQAAIWRDELNGHHQGEWEIGISTLGLLGADLSEMHVAYDRERYLSAREISVWSAAKSEIMLAGAYSLHNHSTTDFNFWDHDTHQPVAVDDNVLFSIESGQYGSLDAWGDVRSDNRWAPSWGPGDQDVTDLDAAKHWWWSTQTSIDTKLLEFVATGWDMTVEELLSHISGLWTYTQRRVGVLPSGDDALARIDWHLQR